ncbi:MAG: glycosyltransferase family 39 protein [Dehalococcoidia bacterium]|nr:glycosyltransferase family 39 protein [Dehalococcoidia bacterium]
MRFTRWRHFPLVSLALLLTLTLGLHLATISNPDVPLFDEQHYIPDARRIISGEGTQREEHPPLAKLIIVGGMEILGDNPWGWRLPAILLSTVSLAAFYDICRRLGTSNKTAFLATMLLGLDNLMFVHSGIAMLDVFLVVFTIFAFWCYMRGPRWWWLSAVSIGLASLCKFSGVFTAIPIGLHWFIIGYKKNMGTPTEEDQALTPTTLELISAFAEQAEPATPRALYNAFSFQNFSPNIMSAIEDSTETAPLIEIEPACQPVTELIPSKRQLLRSKFNKFWKVYSNPLTFIGSMLLAPIVFFLFYAIFDMCIWGHWAPDLLGKIMNALNSTGSIKFAYGVAFPSRPWEWLLSPTGSLYYYGRLFDPTNEKYATVLLGYWNSPTVTGMINPSIWLGGLLSFPYAIWHSFKRNNAAIFVVCWFIGIWLVWIPLALATDRMTYMFYFLPTVGAVALGLSLILTSWLKRAQNLAGGATKQVLKLAAASFLLVHLLSFCIISPLSLTISLPVCALLLIFALFYVGFGKHFTTQFIVSAGIAAMVMRFILYRPLYDKLVSDTAPWGLPEVSSLWVASTLIGIALTWILFLLIQLAIKRVTHIYTSQPNSLESA